MKTQFEMDFREINKKPKKPKKPKKLINQKYKYDSGIACIAMYVGKSYDNIKNKYFPRRNFNHQNMKNVEFEAIMYDLNIQLEEFKDFDTQKDAIVVVKSLNYTKGLHSVYWDSKNQQVYDSQMGLLNYRQKPKKYYTTVDFLKCKKYASFQ